MWRLQVRRPFISPCPGTAGFCLVCSSLLPRPRRRRRPGPRLPENWFSRSMASAVPGYKYIPIEDVERLERYGPGGFHPVAIGDVLHDRYLVVHKLGFGGYSTTWLARDQTTGKYIAVKIAVAAGDSRESDILHRLAAADQQKKTTIAPLLDEFFLKGPNGEHRCFVTAPARMSLSMAQDASVIRLFQLPVARAIAAQLVQAVAFLHTQGIVHADLNPGNILLSLPENLDGLSPNELYEKFGHPALEPIVRLDSNNSTPLPSSVPTHGVMPVWLGERSELIPLSNAGILLTDFGESFRPSIDSRYHSNTPHLLTPPEVFFVPDESLSFPADIWTLAGTIFAILGVRPLFEGFSSSADLVIKDHVDVFGKLPPEWWEKWDVRSKWFDDEGVRVGGLGRPWAERFACSVQGPRQEESAVEEMSAEEMADLSTMLKAMMAFRPEERLTANEILQSAWMRRFALPEVDCMNQKC